MVNGAGSVTVPDPWPECDALIAATALMHGFTVVTRKRDDFEQTVLSLINPWLAPSLFRFWRSGRLMARTGPRLGLDWACRDGRGGGGRGHRMGLKPPAACFGLAGPAEGAGPC